MGGQGHVDSLVDVEPLGVVVELLSYKRCPGHEAEGGVEVLEYELLGDGITARDLAPAVKLCERGGTGRPGQFLAHDVVLLLHRSDQFSSQLQPPIIAVESPSQGGRRGRLLVICRGGHTFCQVVKGRGPDMSWSVNIGSIAGTAVRIHITFLLFLVWIFGASYWAGGA